MEPRIVHEQAQKAAEVMEEAAILHRLFIFMALFAALFTVGFGWTLKDYAATTNRLVVTQEAVCDESNTRALQIRNILIGARAAGELFNAPAQRASDEKFFVASNAGTYTVNCKTGKKIPAPPLPPLG